MIWLERLQPFFAALAVAALAYQGWLVWRRPPSMRSRAAIVILWASVAITLAVFVLWILLWSRYR